MSAWTFGITPLAMVMLYTLRNRGIVAGDIWQKCAKVYIDESFLRAMLWRTLTAKLDCSNNLHLNEADWLGNIDRSCSLAVRLPQAEVNQNFFL